MRLVIKVLTIVAFAALGSVVLAQSVSRQAALGLEQQGQNAEALQAWEAIAAADSRNVEAFAHMGLLAARLEHFDEAIRFYIEALQLNPDFPGLQMNLGLALFKGEHFKEAIQPFTMELREHPGDQRLTILLGMAHYGMRDYLVAIPYLQRAAERYPDNVPIWMALARACLWSKQDTCVLDAYKQVVSLKAGSSEIEMLAGEALDATGDSGDALDHFRSAVNADPKQANAHFGLGYLLWKRGTFAEAAMEFQSELDANPAHWQARAYLADCALELHDNLRARDELLMAVVADDSSAMVHRDLGTLYERAGRREDAVAEFRRAIELDLTDRSAHQRLAALFRLMGRTEEAKSQSAQLSSLQDKSGDPLYIKIADASALP